jgi:nitrilase
MKTNSGITRVAVVQAASVLFDREATVEKAVKLIEETSGKGIKLVLFPEALIPAYPCGLSFGTVVGSRDPVGRQTWQRYWDNAVDVPGPATDRLGKAAREAGIYLGIGVIERDPRSRGTLYCTLLYFNPDGHLLGKHRKLKPTAAERIIWGEGNGSTLPVFDTEIGKIGGLICWENYMPLARMAMYNQGIEIYMAPTADDLESWQSTMIHIACEGRCFVLGCNQFVTKDMYPKDLPGIDDMKNQPEIVSRGGSVIVSPLGKILAGPLWDKEGILTADLDMTEIIRGRMDFDVIGHYARPDVFEFKVKINV